jgi:hypothetical protein
MKKEKLSLDDQQKLDDNITHVQGVLELLFCALSSENPIDPNSGVINVILDAQDRMKRIGNAFSTLTTVQ